MKRSPLWPVVLSVMALDGAALRWWLQGGGTLWTRMALRLYVPDRDLGWRLAPGGVPWLGLDSLAAIAGVTLAVLAAGLVVRWRERRAGRPWGWARVATWVVAAAPLAVPVWAFAGGRGPDGARTRLPMGMAAVARGLEQAARLALPAGTYRVVAHAGTAIVAAIGAGGETFDARFAAVTGSWRGDPGDLSQPMTATILGAAASVDTGVSLRSEHAREILQTARFPTLGFALTRLTGAHAVADGVTFSADGEVTLMGQAVPVVLSGTLRAADGAARARLGLVQPQVLLVSAHFALDLAATPLRPQAKDFDSPTMTIAVNLVLAKESP